MKPIVRVVCKVIVALWVTIFATWYAAHGDVAQPLAKAATPQLQVQQ